MRVVYFSDYTTLIYMHGSCVGSIFCTKSRNSGSLASYEGWRRMQRTNTVINLREGSHVRGGSTGPDELEEVQFFPDTQVGYCILR